MITKFSTKSRSFSIDLGFFYNLRNSFLKKTRVKKLPKFQKKYIELQKRRIKIEKSLWIE